MTYPDSVQFLYALGNEVKTAKLGLDRIALLLDALGAPHRVGRYIHLAGTNGKGSTCAMIEAALREDGRRTGLFTSPHLVEPTERIRVAGEPVTREQFAGAFLTVHRAAERLMADGAIEMHPTYFETVTAMAFVLFRDLGAEWVVLETGLGGRLDATNVVRPEITAITPVDFDHEALLGNSMESIAREKAGILKPGVPAIFSRQRPEAAVVLEARAAELAAPVTRTTDWQVSSLALQAHGSRFMARGAAEVRVDCPLAGEHQVENALTAVAVLVRLGLGIPAIERGIAAARWPGRLERVSDCPEIVLDGAHNPAGARALAAHIDRFYSHRNVWLIYGAMRDKAIHEVGGILFPRARHVVATAPAQARAARPETIVAIGSHPDIRPAPDLAAALALVRASAAPADAVFVTGSLFLVGEGEVLLRGAHPAAPAL